MPKLEKSTISRLLEKIFPTPKITCQVNLGEYVEQPDSNLYHLNRPDHNYQRKVCVWDTPAQYHRQFLSQRRTLSAVFARPLLPLSELLLSSARSLDLGAGVEQPFDYLLLSYTQTGVHIGQNLDLARYAKSRIVHLIDVARRFEFGAIMKDVVCSLQLTTFTQI